MVNATVEDRGLPEPQDGSLAAQCEGVCGMMAKYRPIDVGDQVTFAITPKLALPSGHFLRVALGGGAIFDTTPAAPDQDRHADDSRCGRDHQAAPPRSFTY